mgnify:CR=1 FL=1
MPGWAGSSWYFLRYMDPGNPKEFASLKKMDYWRNVDLYMGGAEHATGHLLYSRFWNKFMYDLGLVVEQEPFKKLINQGMMRKYGLRTSVLRIVVVGPLKALDASGSVEGKVEGLEGDEVADDAGYLAHFAPAQGEGSFKEDDGDGQEEGATGAGVAARARGTADAYNASAAVVTICFGRNCQPSCCNAAATSAPARPRMPRTWSSRRRR